ncbi:Vms1/Ankzf1 family peptidyl-tRNA hydrolase [Conexibacter sp. JD483]|uniref:baeRF10 domain-containing protein n=1 Tax=unclassified Conexibacter TaxID=2627773 RepID=UPI00272805C8|nr:MULTISPECIES: Vms1/Ankzf1 family peptidyl-tRNA hydrolase [unclassified Conexibacter]MDO8185420.1 Vms1/Ankzf1 family peptidyl-tRNA hydrolase [Conexibacter sp. CPCC 205706]MDO8198404.1 Vms1/Ankzf1 family peptidyl-tRNA hydrolase [Conexibacter sp. CPCC 205762]MDR9369366.1 Vms1/Ankzf1 family peptidyl-tRNA hydrolase [Conexibacter sp. JD483]
MQVNDLDHDRLRRLAALHPTNGHKVLSVYMDLDPASFGTQPARAAQISSLVDAAERHARHATLDHDAKIALHDDVARVRDFLRGDEFSAKGAHALALFASGPAELFEVLRLPDAVPGQVVVNDTPWLDPLIGHSRPRRAIALISRRTLRLLADGPDGTLTEVEAFADLVPSQHDKGGYSQANYQRSIEEEVRKHLDHAAAALLDHFRREPFDRLAVGISAELWPEYERIAHAYLRERTLGRFDVDVERATPDQALELARPLFAASDERHLAGLLERLDSGLAHGTRAAAGLGPVLDALNERRVAALLYETGFASPGFACPSSGWLGVGPTNCPSGEENAEPRDNVLEDAIAAAIVQRADVHALRDRPELGPHGGIAALLRF